MNQVKWLFGRVVNWGKTLRINTALKWIAFTVLICSSFLAFVELYIAWGAERSSPVTCALQFEPAPPLRYIEIQLSNQHPIEPTFRGLVFAHVQGSGFKTPTDLKITRSGGRGYLPSVATLEMMPSPDGTTLRAAKAADFDLVSLTGTHRDFPFDSATFDFTLQIEPHLPFAMVRIVNRVPGFVMACLYPVERHSDSSLHIRFRLRRSPLVQITAIVLAVGLVIFLGFIVALHDVKSLAASTASFFFSIWSIRNILGSEIHVFPTLLDCFLLTISICLIIALSWKVMWSKAGLGRKSL